jgi:CheY-like chemotaxis protein
MARILVIEDHAETTRMVKKLLRKSTHRVETALTGEAGMMQIPDLLPDLILMDLGLPDIDGQTLVGIIREQPGLAATRIIAFTAWSPDAARDMAKAYGCDGVITKPIDTRTFVQQVDAFLAGHPQHTPSTEPQQS